MVDFPSFFRRRVTLIAAGASVAAIIPIAAATAGGWHSHGSFGFFFGAPGYYAPPAYYPPPAYYAPPPFYGPPPGYYPSYPAGQAAAPPPPPVMQPQDFTVNFDFDRWNLTADGTRIVDQAIAQARQTGAAQIQVGGFTDLAGSTSYNYALAQSRAVTVRNYMVARGIPTEKIVVKSFGKNDPRVPTPDGVREAQNRRVEIVISPPANVSYGQPPYQGYGQMPSQGYNPPSAPGYYSN